MMNINAVPHSGDKHTELPTAGAREDYSTLSDEVLAQRQINLRNQIDDLNLEMDVADNAAQLHERVTALEEDLAAVHTARNARLH